MELNCGEKKMEQKNMMGKRQISHLFTHMKSRFKYISSNILNEHIKAEREPIERGETCEGKWGGGKCEQSMMIMYEM